MNYTAKEYANILKMVLETQIDNIERDPNYDDNEWLQGIARGIQIAMEKIDDSEFLINN